VKLDDDSLAYIALIVAERPNLIILTDDVYGTFADEFTSLFAICPKNTILVYSYSKYFGATGWRLGVIGTHRDNVLDAQIAALDNEKRMALRARYQSIVAEPDSFKFIDRMVADSRSVALNHTAGLSTPQQVQMVLFSLFALIDTSDSYKTTLKRLIRHRKRALYRAIGIGLGDDEEDVNAVDYYAIIDLELLGDRVHGRKFADWLLSHIDTTELLLKLAREAHVVLLPGRGFGVRHPSGRVSLANLNEADYKRVGQAVRALIEEYVEQFNAENSHEPLPKGKVVK
jgi:aspartate 4-decarboxylase